MRVAFPSCCDVWHIYWLGPKCLSFLGFPLFLLEELKSILQELLLNLTFERTGDSFCPDLYFPHLQVVA